MLSKNERHTALTNRVDHNNNYKKIIEELVRERFNEIKKLTDEKNHNLSVYYFKGNTDRWFDDS